MILRADRPLGKSVRENLLEGILVELERHGPTYELLFLSEAGLQFKIQLPTHVFEIMRLGPGRRINVSLKRKALHLMAG